MRFNTFFSFQQRREVSRHIRLSFAIFFLLLLANFGCQQVSTPQPPPPSSSGYELFKAKCSKCHDPELAMKKYRSSEVWFDTITRMKEEHKADISRQEIDRLVKYHIERQQQETALFKEKCRKCHPGKVFLEQSLTENQAREIIKRMQQKAGNSIEDKDIDIIVRYHVQAQQTGLQESLRNIYYKIVSNEPTLKNGMTLFLEKCSSCHRAEKALNVIKDPEVWAMTIKRMQFYSKGAITDLEAKELVNFHVSQQQKEINTFNQTCTKCHDDKRIISRSLSEEQWLDTIKRMQQKAPELITDEKVNLLSAYFHRRELTMARIFYNKCNLCHLNESGQSPTQIASSKQMDGLITLAKAEFGQSLEMSDIDNLIVTHAERQKRSMQFFENKCKTCHTEGFPEKIAARKKSSQKRSRAEWISFIATLQGLDLNKETQNTINSQIDYHISRH